MAHDEIKTHYDRASGETEYSYAGLFFDKRHQAEVARDAERRNQKGAGMTARERVLAVHSGAELWPQSPRCMRDRIVIKDGDGWKEIGSGQTLESAWQSAARHESVARVENVMAEARKTVEPLIAEEARSRGEVGIGVCSTCKRDYVFCVCPHAGRIIHKPSEPKAQPEPERGAHAAKKIYQGRASYDFIKNGEFQTDSFAVTVGGHTIAECEDSEVADWIAQAWNHRAASPATEMLDCIRGSLNARAEGLETGGDIEVMSAVDRIVARESSATEVGSARVIRAARDWYQHYMRNGGVTEATSNIVRELVDAVAALTPHPSAEKEEGE